jgi:hypothetical protein
MRNHCAMLCLVFTLGAAHGCCSSRDTRGTDPPPELVREVAVLVNEILTREATRDLLHATREEGTYPSTQWRLAETQKAWNEGPEARRVAVTQEVWDEIREFIHGRRQEVHEEARRLFAELTSHP